MLAEYNIGHATGKVKYDVNGTFLCVTDGQTDATFARCLLDRVNGVLVS